MAELIMIFNKRDAVAIFSGKCYMLADVIYFDMAKKGELSESTEEAIESMFHQSVAILGEQ